LLGRELGGSSGEIDPLMDLFFIQWQEVIQNFFEPYLCCKKLKKNLQHFLAIPEGYWL